MDGREGGGGEKKRRASCTREGERGGDGVF